MSNEFSSFLSQGRTFRLARKHISIPNLLAALLFVSSGCMVPTNEISLPVDSVFAREQLVVHSDFYIPSKHRLIDELVAKRGDISEQLKLPPSDESINLYVFKTESEFRKFLDKEHPDFPDRRAFFVKNDTELKVFAFWGQRIGEDLRHEVTHGYLHSVVYNIPLWLDEGIAEFYEVPRGKHGLNSNHIFLLSNAFRRDEWTPNLRLLEELKHPSEMNQLHYAESWLWIHFLLESESGNPKLVQDQLARLRMSAESEPLSKFIEFEIEKPEIEIIKHLKSLSEKL